MKILICHDGSGAAERALRFGASLATACQAEVTLLGIIEASGETVTILDSLKRGLALLNQESVRAELITRSGHPIEEIIRQTAETSYDLVIIGAIRKETSGRFWMSSKSYKIIKEIRPPVLLVAAKVTSVKRILVCSGGKTYIESALPLAGQIARAFDSAVVLLHVQPEPPAILARLPGMGLDVQALLASSSELAVNLRHAKEMLEAMGVKAEVRLRDGAVISEILQELAQGDYELVVTGSALSSNFRTYVLGDITREIVNRVQCAVLVVRAQHKPSVLPFSFKGWFSHR
jgi:nucleotide-binding universal stress UspA family protein